MSVNKAQQSRTSRVSDAEIGEVLRTLRKAKGWTAVEVAAAAGLSPPALLLKAETGQAALTGGQLSAVLAALGANFQILHLRLQGHELDEAALTLLGSVAKLMEEVGG
jgi:transcriptional regulator with XRE-family HTH domain